MTIKDIIRMYEREKEIHGEGAYKQVSKILREAKEIHKADFLKSKTAMKAIAAGKTPDHEQSWKSFKGKNLEKLIEHIVKGKVEKLGLGIINGNKLERTAGDKLPKGLSAVKRHLLVDYGKFGCHLPDVDLVIYHPGTFKVIAVLSSKVTLRERVAQTGYWKIKLASSEISKDIKVFFVTLDEDETLTIKYPAKKGRAIAEIDTDGCYILSSANVQESSVVKLFGKFICDLKKLLK
jgi:type II restriction enzyme